MSTRAHSPNADIARLAQVALVGLAGLAGYSRPAAADVVPTDLGGATIVQNGSIWTITAPNGTIITYDLFDIGLGELVEFIQPDAMARVLNRVQSVTPSMIEGGLTANGIVYIVNPAGVIFGNGAMVDVGGLYAAAGDISDADFLAGIDRFTNLSGIVEIGDTAEIHGHVIHLLAEQVINRGLIESDGGLITLVAGGEVLLQEVGGRVIVHVDGSQLTDVGAPAQGTHAPSMVTTPAVKNSGTIRNDGGRIILGAGDIASLAFRNTGTIEARGGEINVAAHGGLVQNDGIIDASVTSGAAGTVTMQGPSILNRGAIRADAESGQAGTIELVGHDHVFLANCSTVSAAGQSGSADGGSVRLEATDGYTVVADGGIVDATGGATGGAGGTAFIGGDSLIVNGSVQTAGTGDSGALEIASDGSLDVNTVGTDDSFVNQAVVSFIGGPGSGTVRGGAIASANRDVTLRSGVNVNVNTALDFGPEGTDLALIADNNAKINQTLLGIDDLVMHADADDSGAGFNTVDGPQMIGGDALFIGTDNFLRGGDLISGGTQDYHGDTWVGEDMTIGASAVVFHNRLESKSLTPILPRLTIDAATTVFNGAVGEELQLRSLVVTGALEINGGIVSTEEYQTYLGTVDLGADTQLLSTLAGDIHFASTIDGPHALMVDTGGLTRFDGIVGGADKLASLTTDAAGTTLLGADVNAGAVTFGDFVDLAADVHVTGDDAVTFAQGVAGHLNDLAIDSELTTFGGDATGIGILRTDAPGETIIDASQIRAAVVLFGDDVTIERDTLVLGVLLASFDGTIDGPYAMHIVSGELVSLGGAVGGDVPLASLRVDAGGLDVLDLNFIVLDGGLIRAVGDILLNPDGRSAPAFAASIASLGSLLIESLQGSVVMGLNEKMTALGDLTVRAQNGHVMLGDLNALRDILVDAPDIRFWARSGGQLFDFSGNLIADDGADVIAGGSITLTSAPTAVGSGRSPFFFAVNNAQGVTAAFVSALIAAIEAGTFTFGDLVLDLRGFLPTSLAEVIERIEGDVHDRVLRDPLLLEGLERLGFAVRGLSDAELVDLVDGRAVYRDLPPTGMSEAPVPTSASRLRRETLLTALNRYANVFIATSVDPATGETIRSDRTEEVRDALGRAWAAYQASDAPSFGAFVQSAADQQACRDALAGLQELMRSVGATGASRRELRRSIDGVLGPCLPEGMDQAELEQAIGAADLMTRRGTPAPPAG
jgi:filamentous hemagglutinin family protein